MTNVTGTAAGLTAGGNALLAGNPAQGFSASTFTGALSGNATTATVSESDLTDVTATIATGFLTIGLPPCGIKFRNSALTNGLGNEKFVVAALSLATNNIGASLGLVTAVQGRLIMLAIDDGTATPRLGIINSSGGTPLDETGVLTSTTAIAGAVVSPTTVYTAAALAAGLYPYKVVGAVDITWTSGSGYVTTPALVTGAGGNIAFRTPSMVRLNTANGYGSTNTVIRRFTNVVTNQGTDITYADSATLGASFTINTHGVYSISYSDQYAAADWVGVSLNSTQLTTNIALSTQSAILLLTITSVANYSANVSGTFYLPAGSVVRAHDGGSASGTSPFGCIFTITRVS